MSRQIRRERPLHLDPEQYGELKKRVLERDAWKCQHCGRRDQLQIHHIIRRSQTGPDTEANLMVLCGTCHRALHLGGTPGLVGEP